MRLPAFFTFRMTFAQYLAYQSGGSTFVNGALTALSILPSRPGGVMPLWGAGGIGRDTYLTSALLSGLTVLVGSLFVALDVRTRRVEPHVTSSPRHRWFRWLAHHTGVRALASAVFFTAACAPATLFVLERAGVEAMSFHDFCLFKVAYAVVLGAIVTPINAAAVLTRKGDERPRSEIAAAAVVPLS